MKSGNCMAAEPLRLPVRSSLRRMEFDDGLELAIPPDGLTPMANQAAEARPGPLRVPFETESVARVAVRATTRAVAIDSLRAFVLMLMVVYHSIFSYSSVANSG